MHVSVCIILLIKFFIFVAIFFSFSAHADAKGIMQLIRQVSQL